MGLPRALHLAKSRLMDYERRQAREILGRHFDPQAFDRRTINTLLKEHARL
jgi:hypothetical protein